jgi:PHD/YefM family antitoxin component YafN of YafNO toxin-antitoxin module
METVNALEIRNHLGQVLDRLERTGEPILVSKGRRVRAVMITPRDFERRFLDRQAEEKRRELVDRIKAAREPSTAGRSSLELLRQLRGYSS